MSVDDEEINKELSQRLKTLGYKQEFSKKSRPLIKSLLDEIESKKKNRNFDYSEDMNRINRENHHLKRENALLQERLVDLKSDLHLSQHTIQELRMFNSECIARAKGQEMESKQLTNRIAMMESNYLNDEAFLDLSCPLSKESSRPHSLNQPHEMNEDLLDALNLAERRCEDLTNRLNVLQEDLERQDSKLKVYKNQLEENEEELLIAKRKLLDSQTERLNFESQQIDHNEISMRDQQIAYLTMKNQDLEEALNSLTSTHMHEMKYHEKEIEDTYKEKMELTKAMAKIRSLENQLTHVESEREFFKKKFDILSYSINQHPLCLSPPVRDQGYDPSDKQEIENLRNERDKLKDLLNTFEEQLMNVNASVKVLVYERDTLYGQYRTLQHDLEHQQQTMLIRGSTKSTEAAARQSMLRSLQKQLDEALEKVHSLTKERDLLIYKLEAQVQTNINEKSQLFQKAEDAQIMAHRAQLDRDKSMKEIKRIREIAQNLMEDRDMNKERTAELENCLRKMDKLREEVVNKLEIDLKSALRENQTLKQTVSSLTISKQNQDTLLSTYQTEKSQLFRKQSELEPTIEHLGSQVEESNCSIHMLTAQITDLERENKKLKSTVSLIKAELLKERSTKTDYNSQYQLEKNKILSENEKLREDLQNEKMNCERLNHLNSALEKQKTDYESINANLQEDIKSLTASIENQMQEIKNFHSHSHFNDEHLWEIRSDLNRALNEVSKKSDQINTLEESLNSRECTIDHLSQKIDLLNEELVERNDHSMKLEDRLILLNQEVKEIFPKIQQGSNYINGLIDRMRMHEATELDLLERLSRSDNLLHRMQTYFDQVYPGIQHRLEYLSNCEQQLFQSEDQLQNLSMELSRMSPLLHERDSEMKRLQRDYDAAQCLISSLEQRLQDATNSSADLDQNYQCLLVEYENNKAELEKSLNDLTIQTDLLNVEATHSAKIEKDLHKLRKKLGHTQNCKNEAENELNLMRKKFENLNNLYDEKSSSLAAVCANMSDLLNEVSMKSEELEKAYHTLKEYESVCSDFESRFDNKKQETAKLIHSCGELSKSIDDKNRLISEQEMSLDQAKIKIEELSNFMNQKDDLLDSLNDKLKDFDKFQNDARLTELYRANNLDLQDRICEDQKLVCELGSQLEEQIRQNEENHSDVLLALRKLDTCENTIRILQDGVESGNRKNIDLNNELNDVNSTLTEKTSELKATLATLDAREERLQMLTCDIENLKADCLNYEQLKLEHHKFKQIFDRLECKLETLKNKLEDRESALSDVSAQLSERNIEISEKISQLDDAINYIKNVDKKLVDCEEEIQEKNCQLKDYYQMEQELVTFRNCNRYLEERLEEDKTLHSELSKALNDYSKQSEDFQATQSLLNHTTEENLTLQRQNEQMELLIKELREKDFNMVCELAQIDSQLKASQNHNDNLENTLMTLKNDLDVSERSAAKLRVICNNQICQISQLSMSQQSLETQLHQATSDATQFHDQLKDCEARIVHLQSDLDQAVSAFNERNSLVEIYVKDLKYAQETISQLENYRVQFIETDTELTTTKLALQMANDDRISLQKSLEDYDSVKHNHFLLQNDYNDISDRWYQKENEVESLKGELMEQKELYRQEFEASNRMSSANCELQINNEKLSETVHYLQIEVETLSSQLNQMSWNENNLNQELEDLKHKVPAIEARANDLDEQLHLQNNDMRELRSYVAHLEPFKNMYAELELSIKNLQEEKDSLDYCNKKLNERFTIRNNEYHDLIDRFHKLDCEFNKLQDEMKHLKSAARKVADNYEVTTKNNEELSSKILSGEQTLADKEKHLQSILVELKNCCDSCKFLENQLFVEKETVLTLENRLKESTSLLRQNKAESIKEIENCQNKLIQQENRIEKLIDYLRKAENVFELMTTEKLKLEDEVNHLSGINSNQEGWIYSYQERISAWEKEIVKRNRDLQHLTKTLVERDEEIEQLRQAEIQNSEELDRQKQSFDELLKKNAQWKEFYSKIESENRNLEKNLVSMNSEKHCMENNLFSMNTEIDRMKNSLFSMNSEKLRMEQEISQLSGNNSILLEKNSDANQEVEELNRQLSEANANWISNVNHLQRIIQSQNQHINHFQESLRNKEIMLKTVRQSHFDKNIPDQPIRGQSWLGDTGYATSIHGSPRSTINSSNYSQRRSAENLTFASGPTRSFRLPHNRSRSLYDTHIPPVPLNRSFLCRHNNLHAPQCGHGKYHDGLNVPFGRWSTEALNYLNHSADKLGVSVGKCITKCKRKTRRTRHHPCRVKKSKSKKKEITRDPIFVWNEKEKSNINNHQTDEDLINSILTQENTESNRSVHSKEDFFSPYEAVEMPKEIQYQREESIPENFNKTADENNLIDKFTSEPEEYSDSLISDDDWDRPKRTNRPFSNSTLLPKSITKRGYTLYTPHSDEESPLVYSSHEEDVCDTISTVELPSSNEAQIFRNSTSDLNNQTISLPFITYAMNNTNSPDLASDLQLDTYPNVHETFSKIDLQTYFEDNTVSYEDDTTRDCPSLFTSQMT